MADHNPTAPRFDIELGGKTYPLQYRRRDYANAEWRLKMPLLGPQGLIEFWQAAKVAQSKAIDVLLFVGLQSVIAEQEAVYAAYVPPPASSNGHAPPVLEKPPKPWTFEDVQDLITFENSIYVEERVTAAFGQHMPRPPKESEGEEVRPVDGSPLARPNGGIEPGPSADTTSG